MSVWATSSLRSFFWIATLTVLQSVAAMPQAAKATPRPPQQTGAQSPSHKAIAGDPVPTAPATDQPGNFIDVTSASGVHFEGQAYHTSRKYLLETMGSGVALFDYNNDGRLDIFFANGAKLSDPTQPGTIPIGWVAA